VTIDIENFNGNPTLKISDSYLIYHNEITSIVDKYFDELSNHRFDYPEIEDVENSLLQNLTFTIIKQNLSDFKDVFVVPMIENFLVFYWGKSSNMKKIAEDWGNDILENIESITSGLAIYKFVPTEEEDDIDKLTRTLNTKMKFMMKRFPMNYFEVD